MGFGDGGLGPIPNPQSPINKVKAFDIFTNGISLTKGRVRTKTVKKAAKKMIEKFFGRWKSN